MHSIASIITLSNYHSDKTAAQSSSGMEASRITTATDGWQTDYDTEAPADLLQPTPLDNGQGIVIGTRTLSTGQALTLGDGRSKTTLSVKTQTSGETLLVFGTSNTILVQEPKNTKSTYTVPGPVSELHWRPLGDYWIGTKSMAPGAVVTATEGSEEVTYSMFTRGSLTMFGIGTSETFSMDPTTRQTLVDEAGQMTFTRGSDGNLMLEDTKLYTDRPMTAGSGTDRTTLAFAGYGDIPAIVVDGSTTEPLWPLRTLSSTTRRTSANSTVPTSSSSMLPKITHGPTPTSSSTVQTIPTADSSSASATTESRSPVTKTRGGTLVLLLVAFSLLAAF